MHSILFYYYLKRAEMLWMMKLPSVGARVSWWQLWCEYRTNLHLWCAPCRLSQRRRRRGWPPGSSRCWSCCAFSPGKPCWTCPCTARKGERDLLTHTHTHSHTHTYTHTHTHTHTYKRCVCVLTHVNPQWHSLKHAQTHNYSCHEWLILLDPVSR